MAHTETEYSDAPKHGFSMEEATSQINLSVNQKEKCVGWWNAASNYFNNDIQLTRSYDPATLVDGTNFDSGRGWGLDNLIPGLIRTFVAWVLGQSFDIKVKALGSVDDQARVVAARGIKDMLDYYCSKPQFDSDIRLIAQRMKLFNMVAQVDYWDEMTDEPASRIIPHEDIFCDTTSVDAVNHPGGPKWVALRRYLHYDEARQRYGPAAVHGMQTGTRNLNTESSTNTARSYNDRDLAYKDMYEIFEWFGFDYTEVDIPLDETEATAEQEIMAFMSEQPVQPDEDIDHQAAIDFGDDYMIAMANRMLGLEIDVEDEMGIDTALNLLAQAGMGAPAEGYLAWRELQTDFIEDDNPGGTRPKYPGYVYHTEFQRYANEPLIGPQTLEYPHYQIPVSLYRAHLNTDTMFGPGPMAEALPLQVRYEYWLKAQQDHAHYQAHPQLIIDMESMDQKYYASNGWSKLITNMKEGFKVMWMRAISHGGKAIMPHWLEIGKLDHDITRIMEYLVYRIESIIGPTNVMRGQVSGETSGKAYLARRGDAAKPVTDTLMLIEAPITLMLNRKAANIFAYAPLDKIAAISGIEAAQVIGQLREQEIHLECMVMAGMGKGMPRDWDSKANFIVMLLNQHRISAKAAQEHLQLPFPIEELPPPQPTGALGTAQGGNQNMAVPQGV